MDQEHQLAKLCVYIVFTIFGILAGIYINSIGGAIDDLAVFIYFFTFVCGIISVILLGKYFKQRSDFKQGEASQPTQTPQPKSSGEMSEWEKKKNLWQIEQMYRHGDLTFMEYDVLKAKYTGTKSTLEQCGMNFSEYRAFGNAIDADRAYDRQVKSAQRNISYSAGIGAGLGGLGGEIYAGGSTAINEMAKTAEAARNRELAHQKLDEEIRRNH